MCTHKHRKTGNNLFLLATTFRPPMILHPSIMIVSHIPSAGPDTAEQLHLYASNTSHLYAKAQMQSVCARIGIALQVLQDLRRVILRP